MDDTMNFATTHGPIHASGCARPCAAAPRRGPQGLQVRNARAQGWSWQDIADVLGVSRQAVHKSTPP
jgi:hypothetical protein